MWAQLQKWLDARRQTTRSADASAFDSAVPVAQRWVVVDVESSGLDVRRDRLLAIAAVALHFDGIRPSPCIALGDSFEVFIQQTEGDLRAVDKRNILIHGIGIGQQRTGSPAAQALQAWADFAGSSPLVAYHSAFDQTLIDRACQQNLNRLLPNPWLDLEPLAAVVHDDPRHRALDYWLQRYRIQCLTRHQAAADTLATAQFLLAMWPRVKQRVPGGFDRVRDLADSARFMPGR